ncbi:hypothetical protein WG628_21095 [Stenotrophomonas maltophilia]
MIVKTPPNGTTPTAFTVGSQSRIAAVASGFGVVNPQQLQAVTEKVLALAADNAAAQQPASGNGPGVDAPSLRRPALRELQQAARHEGAGRLTPEAALGYFMSELSALLSTDNLEQLEVADGAGAGAPEGTRRKRAAGVRCPAERLCQAGGRSGQR